MYSFSFTVALYYFDNLQEHARYVECDVCALCACEFVGSRILSGVAFGDR